MIKWHWNVWLKTWVWNEYSEYYFANIEVSDWARLYQIGTEDVYSDSCLITWEPIWEIDPNIHCDWNVNFRYYDLSVGLTNFSSHDRKYSYSIEWPEWWATVIWTTNWVINWNGTINSKIKFTRLWTYTITFDIYDWNLPSSEILKTGEKTVTISAE